MGFWASVVSGVLRVAMLVFGDETMRRVERALGERRASAECLCLTLREGGSVLCTRGCRGLADRGYKNHEISSQLLALC